MRKMTTIRIVAFCCLVAAAPASAQTAGPYYHMVPTREVRVPVIAVPVGGQCVTLATQGMGVAAAHMFSLVVPDSSKPERRINVAVDTGAAIVAYSDVRSAADGYQVLITRDGRHATLVSRLSPGLQGSTSPDSMLTDARLGPPSKIAAEVMKRCAPPAPAGAGRGGS